MNDSDGRGRRVWLNPGMTDASDTPAPPKPPALKWAWRIIGAVAALLVVVVIVGLVSGGSSKPEYTVTSDSDQTINVDVVGGTDSKAVVDAVAEQYDDRPDGGYDVMIHCKANGEKLAWGRFAIGQLGAAQTGMEPDSTELRKEYEVDCPN